jgi:hypothetical protein
MLGATVIFIEVFKQALVAGYNKFASPIICMIFCCILALFLLKFIPETFGKDMEFAEDEGQQSQVKSELVYATAISSAKRLKFELK